MNLNRLIVVNNYKVVLFKERKEKKEKMATDLSSFCLICDVCLSMMRKQFVSLFVCLSKLSFFSEFLIFTTPICRCFAVFNGLILSAARNNCPYTSDFYFRVYKIYIILYYIILLLHM